MAVSTQYGEVAIEGIPADEPVVIFRAKDWQLPAVLQHYIQLIRMSGSPEKQAQLAEVARSHVLGWQLEHAEEIEVPGSTRPRLHAPPPIRTPAERRFPPRYPRRLN